MHKRLHRKLDPYVHFNPICIQTNGIIDLINQNWAYLTGIVDTALLTFYQRTCHLVTYLFPLVTPDDFTRWLEASSKQIGGVQLNLPEYCTPSKISRI